MKIEICHCFTFCALALVMNVTFAGAQTTETVGSRALGMGGAFVGVASDSSATWWNPGALAAGPFLDMSLARAVTQNNDRSRPAHRDTASWFALTTPPFGVSYYRLRITDIRPPARTDDPGANPTVTESGNREIEVQSLAANQFGITLVQTLIPGLHAGATFKYLRGSIRAEGTDAGLGIDALLDRGDELGGEETDQALGLDVGLIGVVGPLRAGLLVRNAVEPTFDSSAGTARLQRQARIGVAYDGAAIGRVPLVVALDADLTASAGAAGDRRVVAVGVEQWLWESRLAARGGARFNTTGAKERAATGGVSVAIRAGLFLDAHVVHGGRDDERGWGVAARVSF